MRGMGQWASGLESWGPSWDPPHKKKKKSIWPNLLVEFEESLREKLLKFHTNVKKILEISKKKI